MKFKIWDKVKFKNIPNLSPNSITWYDQQSDKYLIWSESNGGWWKDTELILEDKKIS